MPTVAGAAAAGRVHAREPAQVPGGAGHDAAPAGPLEGERVAADGTCRRGGRRRGGQMAEAGWLDVGEDSVDACSMMNTERLHHAIVW